MGKIWRVLNDKCGTYIKTLSATLDCGLLAKCWVNWASSRLAADLGRCLCVARSGSSGIQPRCAGATHWFYEGTCVVFPLCASSSTRGCCSYIQWNYCLVLPKLCYKLYLPVSVLVPLVLCIINEGNLCCRASPPSLVPQLYLVAVSTSFNKANTNWCIQFLMIDFFYVTFYLFIWFFVYFY